MGGTSEIARYVAAQYFGSFRDYWTHTLHRDWTPGCASFDNAKAAAPDAVAAGNDWARTRGAASIFSSAGGALTTSRWPPRQAHGLRGNRCPSECSPSGGQAPGTANLPIGILSPGPPISGDAPIPQTLNGEPLWDPKGCWIGACLGAFGICYNTDSLARLGIAPQAEWADLGSARYAHELALADPTQSGSVAKAFEMIMQQQIAEAGGNAAEGWLRGMRLIERISANARYFTGEATEIPYSVQSGNAAAGMCIDFYGRFESEAVRRPDGTSRLVYVTPGGGSSTGADSIGLFRGAPRGAGERIYQDSSSRRRGRSYGASVPGRRGARRSALRRLSIHPDLYFPQWRRYEADPEVDPYARARQAVSSITQWTGSLFGVISFVIRTAFIDSHDELKEAWQALINASFRPRRLPRFPI